MGTTQTFNDSHIWIACIVLVHCAMIVWKQTNWVKLQFGLHHDVPKPPKNLGKLYKVDMQGQTNEN